MFVRTMKNDCIFQQSSLAGDTARNTKLVSYSRHLAEDMGLEEVRTVQTLKFQGGKALPTFVPRVVPNIITAKTLLFQAPSLCHDCRKRTYMQDRMLPFLSSGVSYTAALHQQQIPEAPSFPSFLMIWLRPKPEGRICFRL